MKKPYFNQEQRFIMSCDTLSGALFRLELAWKLFLRELSKSKLADVINIHRFGRWLDNF